MHQSSWKIKASAFCLIPLLAPMAALQMSKERPIPMQPRTCRTLRMTSLARPSRAAALLIHIPRPPPGCMMPSGCRKLLWLTTQPYELKTASMHSWAGAASKQWSSCCTHADPRSPTWTTLARLGTAAHLLHSCVLCSRSKMPNGSCPPRVVAHPGCLHSEPVMQCWQAKHIAALFCSVGHRHSPKDMPMHVATRAAHEGNPGTNFHKYPDRW